MAPIARKLIAVLCADVKDYSQHMQRDEDGTIQRLHAYRQLFDQSIKDHHGRIANTAGDSVVAEFASVRDAVTCAVAVQQTLREQNQAVPAEERLQFRIGINLGDVIHRGKDILGDGVNIAARIEGTAEPGGIALSGSVYDSIKHKLPYRYEFQGEQQLKNITEPVRVYKVLLEGTGAGTVPVLPTATIESSDSSSSLLTPHSSPLTQHSSLLTPTRPVTRTVPVAAGMTLALVLVLIVIYWLRNVNEEPDSPLAAPTTETVAETPTPLEAPAPARIPNSVAVLPFANLSPDPEQDFFSDGLSEELLNHLAQINGLRVIARTSSFAFKGQNRDVRDIAAILKVTHVLEGSVRKAGNALRITAQLINANDGTHLWSKTYERTLNDVFAIQDDISIAVAQAFKVTLGLDEFNRPGWTRNVAAYEEYLRGVSYGRQMTPQSLPKAVEYYLRSIDIDPAFILARTALVEIFC